MKRNNPFKRKDGWYWRHDLDMIVGPYVTERDALRAMLPYCSRWERIKFLLTEFARV